MQGKSKLREWATPIIIGAFALSAVTGVMLFFKIQLGFVKPVHEWLSWLLVIGAILHMIVNRPFFMKYISKPVGRSILIFFFLLICVSMLPLDDKQRRHPFAKIADTLINSPLLAVAKVANHEPDEVISILKSNGIYTDSKDQTIREIAMKNDKDPLRILDSIF